MQRQKGKWVQQDSHTQAGKKENERNTLFLQNWTGVLKVGVTITSFPIVAAPPATVSAPRPFQQDQEECSPAISQQVTAAEQWTGEESGRWDGGEDRQASVSDTHPQNKKATKPMGKKREKEN